MIHFRKGNRQLIRQSIANRSHKTFVDKCICNHNYGSFLADMNRVTLMAHYNFCATRVPSKYLWPNVPDKPYKRLNFNIDFTLSTDTIAGIITGLKPCENKS